MSIPRTSIIMPVYNTATTVTAAIQSIQNQTDKNFELIIIIDGTPDNSLEAINQHLTTHPDPRIHITNNPTNRGVSATRNQALNTAQGQWITFIDSDDELTPEFLETMHRHTDGVDVVSCAHYLINDAGEKTVRLKGTPGVRTGQQAAFELLEDRISPYPWDKLIRSELLEGVRFPEDIHRAEDECLLLDCYLKATGVAIISDPLYRYLANTASLTWSRITPVDETHRLVRYFTDALGSLRAHPRARKSLATARVLAFLNNAQQALVVGGDTAAETIRRCRGGYGWGDIAVALQTQPIFGAAGALLKLSPAAYRLLYGAYIRRVYGINK